MWRTPEGMPSSSNRLCAAARLPERKRLAARAARLRSIGLAIAGGASVTSDVEQFVPRLVPTCSTARLNAAWFCFGGACESAQLTDELQRGRADSSSVRVAEVVERPNVSTQHGPRSAPGRRPWHTIAAGNQVVRAGSVRPAMSSKVRNRSRPSSAIKHRGEAFGRDPRAAEQNRAHLRRVLFAEDFHRDFVGVTSTLRSTLD